jgi:hypothetical protein
MPGPHAVDNSQSHLLVNVETQQALVQSETEIQRLKARLAVSQTQNTPESLSRHPRSRRARNSIEIGSTSAPKLFLYWPVAAPYGDFVLCAMSTMNRCPQCNTSFLSLCLNDRRRHLQTSCPGASHHPLWLRRSLGCRIDGDGLRPWRRILLENRAPPAAPAVASPPPHLIQQQQPVPAFVALAAPTPLAPRAVSNPPVIGVPPTAEPGVLRLLQRMDARLTEIEKRGASNDPVVAAADALARANQSGRSLLNRRPSTMTTTGFAFHIKLSPLDLHIGPFPISTPLYAAACSKPNSPRFRPRSRLSRRDCLKQRSRATTTTSLPTWRHPQNCQWRKSWPNLLTASRTCLQTSMLTKTYAPPTVIPRTHTVC